jgi:hypothetical protein
MDEEIKKLKDEIRILKNQLIKILSIQKNILDLLDSKESQILINNMLNYNKSDE